MGQDVEWDSVLFQLLLLSHWELELTAEGRLPSVPAPEQRKSLGQHPSSGTSREKKNPLSQPSPQLPRVHRKLWGQQLRELLEVLQPLSGHCCDNRGPSVALAPSQSQWRGPVESFVQTVCLEDGRPALSFCLSEPVMDLLICLCARVSRAGKRQRWQGGPHLRLWAWVGAGGHECPREHNVPILRTWA